MVTDTDAWWEGGGETEAAARGRGAHMSVLISGCGLHPRVTDKGRQHHTHVGTDTHTILPSKGFLFCFQPSDLFDSNKLAFTDLWYTNPPSYEISLSPPVRLWLAFNSIDRSHSLDQVMIEFAPYSGEKGTRNSYRVLVSLQKMLQVVSSVGRGIILKKHNDKTVTL